MLLRVLDARLDVGGVLVTQLEEAVATTTARWQHELEAALAAAGVEGTRARRAQRPRRRSPCDYPACGLRTRRIAHRDGHPGAGRLRHALLGSNTLGVVGASDLPVMVTGSAIEPPPTGVPYRVVATTDGSAASRVAMRALGPLLAGATSSEVTLLRLVWPGANEGRDAAEADLRDLRATLPPDLRVTELVRETPMVEGVATAITSAAKELGASTIAMATHGHGAAYHLFAGSVALGVVGHSPLPVILVGARK